MNWSYTQLKIIVEVSKKKSPDSIHSPGKSVNLRNSTVFTHMPKSCLFLSFLYTYTHDNREQWPFSSHNRCQKHKSYLGNVYAVSPTIKEEAETQTHKSHLGNVFVHLSV